LVFVLFLKLCQVFPVNIWINFQPQQIDSVQLNQFKFGLCPDIECVELHQFGVLSPLINLIWFTLNQWYNTKYYLLLLNWINLMQFWFIQFFCSHYDTFNYFQTSILSTGLQLCLEVDLNRFSGNGSKWVTVLQRNWPRKK